MKAETECQLQVIKPIELRDRLTLMKRYVLIRKKSNPCVYFSKLEACAFYMEKGLLKYKHVLC